MAYKVYLKSGNICKVESALYSKINLKNEAVFFFYSSLADIESMTDMKDYEALCASDAFFYCDSVQGIVKIKYN